MFLKRVDVLGFKSFADKTKLEFSTGITAVVGPNGSGKSNIADAIRWVLGEQSARSLRGIKMEDVIFAGSDTRRSVNFCEVSLTLDNQDQHLSVLYDEVTVTRRVYRSGESEYMLNKQPCRLKDITELFMDSGLGRESYSIIGQGRIEEMLSTRPEDRRGPFEDAAGIVKYKFRRKDAERKLEETAVNLLRVDDILAELSRQAGPLEQEAEKAKQFKLLRDDLSEKEISLLVKEIEGLQARWKLAREIVEQLDAQRQQATGQLKLYDDRLRKAKEFFDSRSRVAEDLQRQLMSSTEERQRLEGTVALLQERFQNTRAQMEDKHRQIAQIEVEAGFLEQQKQESEQRLREVTGRLVLRTADCEAASSAVEPSTRAALEAEMERLNEELIQAHHQSATLRNEVKVAQESTVQDGKQRERLSQEQSRFQAELTDLTDFLLSLTKQQEEQQQLDVIAQQRVNACSLELRRLSEQEASCVAALHQVQSATASLQSRAELLKDLEDGYDGYALGVRTVLQAGSKGRLHGIHGSLASLLTVPKEYETAVEITLGAALQNIVVETEADARVAIEMLKTRQAGRATFMPLSVIKSRLLSQHDLDKIQRHAGFIGLASTLVKANANYANLIEHLLGNVVVAQQLVAANELARLLNYRVRVVTLDGDVVIPGGVMSGGSHQRKGPGLLGRTRERQEVQARLMSLSHEQDNWRQQQAMFRQQIEAMQEQQRMAGQELENSRLALIALQAQMGETRTRKQGVVERLNALDWEWGQLEEGRTAWESRAAVSRASLLDVEQSLLAIEGQLLTNRKALEDWDQTVAMAQERLTRIRVELATLTQEQAAVQQQLDDLTRRMVRFLEQKRQLATELEVFRETLVQTEVTELQAKEQLFSVSQGVQELDQQLFEVRDQRQVAEVEVVAAEKVLRDQQQTLTALEEQMRRQEVLAERTDLELNHALQRIGENYHMTYEWARSHYPPPESIDAVRRQAEQLKRQLNEMGEVNLSAIDEWSRLSERIDFLQSEQMDLRQAESQLQDVIREIDDEMSKRFRETFEQIRTEFEIAFRHLFNGGKADLQLTEPENVLRTGIEVIAQPPGKKLQNLNLLSGGERALTAMALLFAILRVRPVPFCVLDEVEAALDEANVGRFAQYVRRFSDETQFIVITHRRGTMEEADVLYGVTMQESGVSSLIGVRLTDDSGFETA